jgi:hypothetical protein
VRFLSPHLCFAWPGNLKVHLHCLPMASGNLYINSTVCVHENLSTSSQSIAENSKRVGTQVLDRVVQIQQGWNARTFSASCLHVFDHLSLPITQALTALT